MTRRSARLRIDRTTLARLNRSRLTTVNGATMQLYTATGCFWDTLHGCGTGRDSNGVGQGCATKKVCQEGDDAAETAGCSAGCLPRTVKCVTTP